MKVTTMKGNKDYEDYVSAIDQTVPVGTGRVARLHKPPSKLQLEVIEELVGVGYPCYWEGVEWMHERIRFSGIDRHDYAGPYCEAWIEFSNPYTLDGARLQVECPHPYRQKVRNLYLGAFQVVTSAAIKGRENNERHAKTANGNVPQGSKAVPRHNAR